MSTRACYRFIDPYANDPEAVTDGYPDSVVCGITNALEHAWPLIFEAGLRLYAGEASGKDPGNGPGSDSL